MPEYCYITADQYLEIVDVINPANPTHTGSVDIGTLGRDVFKQGDYCWVVANDYLLGVNITVKTAPVLATTFYDATNLDNAEGLFIRDNWVYVVGGTGAAGYLQLVDISDKANPVLGGRITSGGTTRLFTPRRVYVRGNYAFIITAVDAGNGSALEIIDISDKQNPAHESSEVIAASNLQGLWLRGNYAYVTDDVSDGVYVIDVSDVTAPNNVGDITNPPAVAAVVNPEGCFTIGNHCYVTSGSDGGSLSLVNISDKTNPVQDSALAHGDEGGLIELQGAVNVRVLKNFAFVIAETSDCLQVIDVNSKLAPTYEGRINDGDGGAQLNGPTSIYMDIWDNVVNFSGVPRDGANPLVVQFTDLSTTEGTIVKWTWDFGDGNTSTSQNPEHTYTTPGIYTVSLTVEN